MSYKKSTSIARTCGQIWSWIIMIHLWITIFLYMADKRSINKNSDIYSLIFLGIVYIAYVITALSSATYTYLRNNHMAESIHEYMKNMFYTPPNITWRIECYHFEKRVTETKTEYGTNNTKEESVKVVSHTETQSFNYYSWKDISGLFVLDSHKIFLSQKYYIKLELEQCIEFADDITKAEYQRQKDDFYERNRWRDTHVSLTENRQIAGFNQFNMVKISSDDPAFVSVYIYLLFVFIIPFVELYKMYVDQLCVEQDYKLTKIISTRYNLNHPKYSKKYENLAPGLALYDQPRQLYDDQTVLTSQSPHIPSLDDLDETKKYSDFNYSRDNYLNDSQQNYQPYYGNQNSQNFETAGNYSRKSYDHLSMNGKIKFS